MPGSSNSSSAPALGQARPDPAADQTGLTDASGMSTPDSSAGQTETGNAASPGSSSPAEALFLAWQAALEELQTAFASIPGIGDDQFAQLRDLLDSIVSVLHTIGDSLSQSDSGFAATGSTTPLLNSIADYLQTTGLASSDPHSESLASVGQRNTSAYGFASDAGPADLSSNALAAPFVFDDIGGQYGLADLFTTNAVAGAGQNAVELWANLLDVYRPSGQAALGLGQSEGGSTASVLAASSLAQNPTGA